MSGEPKSWQSYIDQFLVYSEVNCRVNTIRYRKFHLKTLRGYFGDMPREALKPEHLEQYKRERLALRLSKSTINGELKGSCGRSQTWPEREGTWKSFPSAAGGYCQWETSDARGS